MKFKINSPIAFNQKNFFLIFKLIAKKNNKKTTFKIIYNKNKYKKKRKREKNQTPNIQLIQYHNLKKKTLNQKSTIHK